MTPTDLRNWMVEQPKRPTRAEMAQRYSELLIEHWNQWGSAGDWSVLNNAILDRWSVAGLNFIKQQAWKIAEAAMARARARAGVA